MKLITVIAIKMYNNAWKYIYYTEKFQEISDTVWKDFKKNIFGLSVKVCSFDSILH